MIMIIIFLYFLAILRNLHTPVEWNCNENKVNKEETSVHISFFSSVFIFNSETPSSYWRSFLLKFSFLLLVIRYPFISVNDADPPTGVCSPQVSDILVYKTRCTTHVALGTGWKVPKSVFVNSIKPGLEIQRAVKVCTCVNNVIPSISVIEFLAVSLARRIQVLSE